MHDIETLCGVLVPPYEKSFGAMQCRLCMTVEAFQSDLGKEDPNDVLNKYLVRAGKKLSN